VDCKYDQSDQVTCIASQVTPTTPQVGSPATSTHWWNHKTCHCSPASFARTSIDTTVATDLCYSSCLRWLRSTKTENKLNLKCTKYDKIFKSTSIDFMSSQLVKRLPVFSFLLPARRSACLSVCLPSVRHTQVLCLNG